VTSNGHDAADRLDLAVVAGTRSLWTGLAEAGDCAIDQPRIDPGQHFIADPELVHHSRPKVLHHHVGLRGKLLHDPYCLRLREVERQTAFVAVDGLPARCEPAVGPFPTQGRSAHILALAPLDLDDVGSEQRQLIARIGTGQDLREVENLHAFERSGHGDIPQIKRGCSASAITQCYDLQLMEQRAWH
jgi:hypothetical protein